MYESDIQSNVSESIIDGEVEEVDIAITDSELCVVVNIGDEDAAYTADEARELAQSLKCVSDQRWDGDNDDVVEYIRDLADVVDGDKGGGEVRKKWQDREIDNSL
jgi:hypothetical protein